MTSAFDGTVTMIDVAVREAVRTVDVGHNPNGVSFSPASAPPAGRGMVALDLPHGQLHGDHDHVDSDRDGGHDHGGHAAGARN